jgi:hypothetical protein
LFCASYYMGQTLCTLILGEAGQLRSFGDQWQNLSSTGRQQYGHGTKGVAGQGLGQGTKGVKAATGEYSSFRSFRAQGGQGGWRSKDYKTFKKTGGKKGVPKD